MQFFLKAKVEDGELVVLNKTQVRDFLLAHEGQYFEISVRELEETMSASWMRWYRGIAIGTIQRELFNQTGDWYEDDEIHAYNIAKVAKPRIRTREALGETIVESKGFSLRGLTKKKWFAFKDQLLAFWSNRGIDIPEPGDNNFSNDDETIQKIRNFSIKPQQDH
jgi:hypothetical protein